MVSEIIVGIDSGTTFSGVSWAVNAANRKIRLINNWPNPNATNAYSDKVPNVISYKDGKPHNWGYNVNVTEGFKAVKASHNLLQTLHKSVEDVTADYLRLLWQYTVEDIQSVYGDRWRRKFSIKVILTIPAIWSSTSKDKTLKVTRAAGLPKNVVLVPEPEAAALSVLREKDEDKMLYPGDCFVVCDAGGCTVTIVSEEKYERLKPRARIRMMQQFEMYVKRCYAGDDKPFSVELQGIEDNEQGGIDDDNIKLKPDKLKTMFDTIITKVIALVASQIEESQIIVKEPRPSSWLEALALTGICIRDSKLPIEGLGLKCSKPMEDGLLYAEEPRCGVWTARLELPRFLLQKPCPRKHHGLARWEIWAVGGLKATAHRN